MYVTYKLINNKNDLRFYSEIESKLYESYIKKITKLFEEEQRVDLLLDQKLQRLIK
jgi:hypothetical protein